MKNIFNNYTTYQGIPFLFLNRSITFPSDYSLDIYQYKNVDDDYPWTIMSYKLYGSIDYWWILSALNKDMKFYAKRGTTIRIIAPNKLKTVLKYIVR